MKRVKPLKELISILLADGYKPDLTGAWVLKNCTIMTSEMLMEAGEVYDDIDGEYNIWDERWLETIIEYPCIMKKKNEGLIVHVNVNATTIVIEAPVNSNYQLGEISIMLDPDEMDEEEEDLDENTLVRVNGKPVLYLDDFELFAEIKKV